MASGKIQVQEGTVVIPDDATFTILQTSDLSPELVSELVALLEKARSTGIHPDLDKASISGTSCKTSPLSSDFTCGDSDS